MVNYINEQINKKDNVLHEISLPAQAQQIDNNAPANINQNRERLSPIALKRVELDKMLLTYSVKYNEVESLLKDLNIHQQEQFKKLSDMRNVFGKDIELNSIFQSKVADFQAIIEAIQIASSEQRQWEEKLSLIKNHLSEVDKQIEEERKQKEAEAVNKETERLLQEEKQKAEEEKAIKQEQRDIWKASIESIELRVKELEKNIAENNIEMESINKAMDIHNELGMQLIYGEENAETGNIREELNKKILALHEDLNPLKAKKELWEREIKSLQEELNKIKIQEAKAVAEEQAQQKEEKQVKQKEEAEQPAISKQLEIIASNGDILLDVYKDRSCSVLFKNIAVALIQYKNNITNFKSAEEYKKSYFLLTSNINRYLKARKSSKLKKGQERIDLVQRLQQDIILTYKMGEIQYEKIMLESGKDHFNSRESIKKLSNENMETRFNAMVQFYTQKALFEKINQNKNKIIDTSVENNFKDIDMLLKAKDTKSLSEKDKRMRQMLIHRFACTKLAMWDAIFEKYNDLQKGAGDNIPQAYGVYMANTSMEAIAYRGIMKKQMEFSRETNLEIHGELNIMSVNDSKMKKNIVDKIIYQTIENKNYALDSKDMVSKREQADKELSNFLKVSIVKEKDVQNN